MRVFHNDQLLFVGWKYDHPHNTNVTVCEFRNSNKEVVYSATVNRYHLDVHDRDKARRFSLTKLLRKEFPGRENKQFRAEVWHAYMTRNIKQIINPVH